MENDGFNEYKATDKQIRLYFKLMKERGFKGKKAKEILKKRFDLEHFLDIDKHRMSYVIDRLLKPKQ